MTGPESRGVWNYRILLALMPFSRGIGSSRKSERMEPSGLNEWVKSPWRSRVSAEIVGRRIPELAFEPLHPVLVLTSVNP
jgi:hypothetical protein